MTMGSSAWKPWVLDEGDSVALLRHALDLGINFLDMADWSSLGGNEEVVGRSPAAPRWCLRPHLGASTMYTWQFGKMNDVAELNGCRGPWCLKKRPRVRPL